MDLPIGRINDRPIISNRGINLASVKSIHHPQKAIPLNSFTCSVGDGPGYGVFVLKRSDAIALARKKYVTIYLGYEEPEPEVPLLVLRSLIPVGIHDLQDGTGRDIKLCGLEVLDVRFHWDKVKVSKVYNWQFTCLDGRMYAISSLRNNTFTTTTTSTSTTTLFIPEPWVFCRFDTYDKCVRWTWRTILIDLFCQLIASAGLTTTTSTTTGTTTSTTIPIFPPLFTTEPSLFDDDRYTIDLPIKKNNPTDPDYTIQLPGGVSADWESVPNRLFFGHVSPVVAINECLKAYGNALFCFDPIRLSVSIRMNGEDDLATQALLEQYQDNLVYTSDDLLPIPAMLPEIVRVSAIHIRNPNDLALFEHPIVGVDVNIEKYANAYGIFLDQREYRAGTTVGVLSPYVIISGRNETPYGWHNCELIPPEVEYPCPTPYGMFARDGSPCQTESDFVFHQASCRPFLRMAYRVFDYFLRRWPSTQIYRGLIPVVPSGRVHTVIWREDKDSGGYRTELKFHPDSLDLFITKYEVPPRDSCCCPTSTSTTTYSWTTTRSPCAPKHPCCYPFKSTGAINCEILYSEECGERGGAWITFEDECNQTVLEQCRETTRPPTTTCPPHPGDCCPNPYCIIPEYDYVNPFTLGNCCVSITIEWTPPTLSGPGSWLVPADVPDPNELPPSERVIKVYYDPNAVINKAFGPAIGGVTIFRSTDHSFGFDAFYTDWFPGVLGDFLPSEVLDYYENAVNPIHGKEIYNTARYAPVEISYRFFYGIRFGAYSDPTACLGYTAVLTGAFCGVGYILRAVDDTWPNIDAFMHYNGKFNITNNWAFVYMKCFQGGWPEVLFSYPSYEGPNLDICDECRPNCPLDIKLHGYEGTRQWCNLLYQTGYTLNLTYAGTNIRVPRQERIEHPDPNCQPPRKYNNPVPLMYSYDPLEVVSAPDATLQVASCSS
ncbi:MAG: hypothetical protein QXT45_08245 [Candidatus Bilamarchaeaceae archaeon]